MTCVRIIGGGLTGILAAFQAHRMGARRIELHERLDRLGGIALPELHGTREMREGCIYFGPAGDPIRQQLEAHGAAFEDFDNRFGSVSPGLAAPIYTRDFGGPALPASTIDLTAPRGESLADRLACYSDDLAFALARYVRWHVGCDPAQLHAGAAIPLAINRVFPSAAPLDRLSAAKQGDSLANDLFGIPRSLWNYTSNSQASLPVGGFTALFRQCRTALEAIGVRIHNASVGNPRELLGTGAPDDILVWAASPMPLFKAMGLEAPRAPAKRFATYTFEARWTGPVPFYVQNFTAEGSCFRAYIYQSEGSILLTAECVSADGGDDTIADIHHLLAGFDGKLVIGELLMRTLKPRWLYHSVDTIEKLASLRRVIKAQRGGGFVAGAWEAYAKGEKFTEVEAELHKALAGEPAVEAV